MNVTIKIQDTLGQAARHRAVDAGLSLSGWISAIVARELAHPSLETPRTLLDALGNEDVADLEIDFSRLSSSARPVDLS